MPVFNVRVYGIVVHDNKILVSDLLFHGRRITKFCGGGLEHGEGTRDCLKREFREELGIDVEVGEHIYTTDFFQPSAFHPDHQIISVYYYVRPKKGEEIAVVDEPFQFTEEQLRLHGETGEAEVFRFIDLRKFTEDEVTLPIDKAVARIIEKKHTGGFFDRELILEDGLVRLEPLSMDHLDALWAVASDHDLWALSTIDVVTKADLEKYMATALRDRSQHAAYPFAVFHKKLGRYVGSTRYGNISEEHKRLEIGWTWYEKSLHGTGMNTHNKYLLLKNAFETMGFHRVELKTSHRNLRSQAAIKKIGGVQEGVFRKHMLNPDGSFRHTVYFSILDDEWPRVKSALEKMMTEQTR